MRHCVPWKSAIVLVNAARSLAYSTAYMSAPSARPIPRAATIGRIAFSPSMQSWKPPISPTTFSSGTNTLSSSSSPVSTPFTPIFLSVRPTDTPSKPRSTMKTLMLSWARESAGPVLAKTQYQSACTTPLIQHFVPVRRQPSPSRSARVRIPITSLPACGSDRPNAARCTPVASGVRYFCFCSSDPAIRSEPVGGRVRVLRDLLDRDREAEDAGAGAAVGLRDAQPGEAGLYEEVEEILRVLLGHVDLAGPGLDLVLGDPTDGGLELLELRRKIEIHERSSLPVGGRPLRVGPQAVRRGFGAFPTVVGRTGAVIHRPAGVHGRGGRWRRAPTWGATA